MNTHTHFPFANCTFATYSQRLYRRVLICSLSTPLQADTRNKTERARKQPQKKRQKKQK